MDEKVSVIDKVFGEHLHKWKEPAEVEGNEDLGSQCYFEATPVNDVIGKEGLEYVLVLFSAQYCPPCQKLQGPLKTFYDEYVKDGKSEMVMINCDEREKEYKEHLKTM